MNPAELESLLPALSEHFGYGEFLPGQEEAVGRALAGEDVVLIMPTGSGKSLCYQLTAMLLDGVTVVISPLIALMKDQVDTLERAGIPATFINSSLTSAEMRGRLDGLRAGAYKLVYVAPERFRIPSFNRTLAELSVSLLAVDEAHCISQWGHDFRPDYCRLKEVVQRLPASARVMALTATATPHVRDDITTQLGLDGEMRAAPAVLVHGFARPNLHLHVHQTATHDQKRSCLLKVIEDYPTGLVYCSTRKQVEAVHAALTANKVLCGYYHAGLTDEERKETQDRFMDGSLPVVVATNAFGMGVDRSDLRFVVHWDIPGSLEAYYQEVGRAGRDGETSRCDLLFNYADVRTQRFFIEGANPDRSVVEALWKTVRRACSHGPVTRSIKEWNDAVGVSRNEMATRSAMAILERAGLIAREIEAGERSYAVDLVPDAPPKALEAQYEALEAKRKADERKLSEILGYVTAPGCRHAYILGYFGDPDAADACQACDHCTPRARTGLREPSEAEWEVVQKILSCAARMKGQFGRARLVQVLRGSREADLLQRGLDQLPTYGLLQAYPEPYVRSVVDELIRDQCLRIEGREYPLVVLTGRGRDVMWKKETPRLAWPRASVRTSSSRKAADSAEAWGEADPAVLEALKGWRKQRALQDQVPAFVVCHDRTLQAIAAVKPDTLAGLEEVKGMGPAKVEKYGDEILEVLDRVRA